MSNLLVIDTSSSVCSVMLRTSTSVAVRQRAGSRTHGQFLLAAIVEVAGELSLDLSELNAVAAVAGPGSFTGIRIGIGVVQGLTAALSLPVILISSLEWLACEALAAYDCQSVMVCRKARDNEYYVGSFRRDADALVRRIGEETVIAASDLVLPDSADGMASWIAVGDGWAEAELGIERYPAVFKRLAVDLEPGLETLGRLAGQKLAEGQLVSAEQAIPNYLKENMNYRTAISNETVK